MAKLATIGPDQNQDYKSCGVQKLPAKLAAFRGEPFLQLQV